MAFISIEKINEMYRKCKENQLIQGREFLPFLEQLYELRQVINNMFGELNKVLLLPKDDYDSDSYSDVVRGLNKKEK